MTRIAEPKKRSRYISMHFIVLLTCLSVTLLALVQTKTLLQETRTRSATVSSYDAVDHRSVSSLRNAHLNDDDQQCRWYLAESAIPKAGLGLFTATGLLPDETVGFPDICIFVSDAPDHWTHLRGHSFGGGTFFGQYEGRNSRAACEGFTTIFNTQPNHLVNSELVSPILPTNAGLHRQASPGAGSVTHHYGIHAKAKDTITAGSELLIDYGDWDFDPRKEYTKPERPVEWLEKHGWCIDHLRVGPSTIPNAGRGAFARHSLKQGQVVAPVPLQSFEDRTVFQNTEPEQLYVNYCLQPKDSKMIFYPYGPIFNLVNHPDTNDSGSKPNVYLQWSSSNMHHSSWLDMSYDDFWEVTSPGGLILEVVASRDIEAGEEILLDYGQDWQEAWNAHQSRWKPPKAANAYVYPAQMDETSVLRTVKEQKTDPYPDNLLTMCSTNWRRRRAKHLEWSEPNYAWNWKWLTFTYCHILEREMTESGNYVYTVELTLSNNPKRMKFDESKPFEDRLIDYHVPRRAIRFLEKPYMDDEHLPNAFRQPIEFPAHLVPDAWRNA